MNMHRNGIVIAASGLLCAAMAYAQSPPPTTGNSAEPSAASSPHQRGSTGVDTAEAQTAPGEGPSAASTKHQRDVTGEEGGAHKGMHGASATTFIEKAAMGGMTEVKLADLALQKSQNQDVRKFATDMKQDHSQANSELESIASSKNVTVPATLDKKHQAILDSLSAKSGAEFDSAYSKYMVKDHRQAVALFKQAQSSKDSDISGFAAKTLPTLEEHQKMANGLESKMRMASAGGSTKR